MRVRLLKQAAARLHWAFCTAPRHNDGGDASKQELMDRLTAGMEYFNGDPPII